MCLKALVHGIKRKFKADNWKILYYNIIGSSKVYSDKIIKELQLIRNVEKIMKYILSVTIILFLSLIYSNDIVKANNEADFIIKDGVLLEYVGNAKDVIIPAGVTSIDKDVFDDKEIASVVIPDGVTEIKEWTFFQSSLESIEIPQSVVSIGMGAFCESNLKKVILPDDIAIIPKRAFDSCKDLTEVKLPKNLLYINPEAFQNTGLTAIEIPNRVETIGGEAFFESDLVTVTMSDGVKEIGFAAFQDCHKLKKVRFSNNLEIISGSAFMYCTKLQSLDIPKSVTEIGEEAFFGCKSIKSMTMGGLRK